MQKFCSALLRVRPLSAAHRRSVATTVIEKPSRDGDKSDSFKFGLKEEHAFRASQERARAGDGKRGGGTVDADETAKFRAMADQWWDPDGDCKPLHSMNQLRVRLVLNGLAATGRIRATDGPGPLRGVRIVDVGSGGGILCEPLARLGAEVTGLEPVDESRQVAARHAKKDPEIAGRITYLPTTVEEFADDRQGQFDAVIASEAMSTVVFYAYIGTMWGIAGSGKL